MAGRPSLCQLLVVVKPMANSQSIKLRQRNAVRLMPTMTQLFMVLLSLVLTILLAPSTCVGQIAVVHAHGEHDISRHLLIQAGGSPLADSSAVDTYNADGTTSTVLDTTSIVDTTSTVDTTSGGTAVVGGGGAVADSPLAADDIIGGLRLDDIAHASYSTSTSSSSSAAGDVELVPADAPKPAGPAGDINAGGTVADAIPDVLGPGEPGADELATTSGEDKTDDGNAEVADAPAAGVDGSREDNGAEVAGGPTTVINADGGGNNDHAAATTSKGDDAAAVAEAPDAGDINKGGTVADAVPDVIGPGESLTAGDDDVAGGGENDDDDDDGSDVAAEGPVAAAAAGNHDGSGTAGGDVSSSGGGSIHTSGGPVSDDDGSAVPASVTQPGTSHEGAAAAAPASDDEQLPSAVEGGEPSAVALSEVDWPVLAALKASWEQFADLSSWEPTRSCVELQYISCDSTGRVISLQAPEIGLGGTFPAAIASLESLVTLDLSRNYLSGHLPRALSRLSNIKTLNLGVNQFEGVIPEAFGPLTNIQFLSLASNHFTDNIPDTIGECVTLTHLDLSDNEFDGNLPDTFFFLTSIVTLSVHGNQLSGSIASFLPSLTTIQAIDLSSNFFSGSVPGSLSLLSNLNYFDISDNQLTGPVPSNFLSSNLRDPDYGIYAINQNYFTGSPAVTSAGEQFCPQEQASGASARLQIAGSDYGSQERNCLVFPDGFPCDSEWQRSDLECAAFCGATNPEGPCGGRGTCFLSGPSSVPECRCDPGFFTDSINITVGDVTLEVQTCSVIPSREQSETEVVPIGPFYTGYQPGWPEGSAFNPFFRYASVGFTGSAANPSWIYSESVDWRDVNGVNFLTPIRKQSMCAGCWAFAPIATVESAVAIQQSLRRAPKLSVQEVLDCQGEWNCETGGWPGDAFSYIAKLSATRAKGLANDAQYQFTGSSKGSEQCQGMKGTYSISMYEQAAFYGSFGLLLTVQNQPAVVTIEADQYSFTSYTGDSVYADPDCFANHILNHNVVVVGFNINAPVPYWIIRNSWGATWGDGGYMQMAITGGDGICGINTSPALYPVVKGPDPCGPINPCGKGTCFVDLASNLNICECPEGFVAVTASDGSQTCSPTDVCTFFQNNPCGSGSCTPNGRGSYSCLCPLGYRNGLRADGTLTCVPGIATSGIFKTDFSTQSCYTVAMAYGLTVAQLVEQNPGLNCDQPVDPLVDLNVNNAALSPCNVTYAATPFDSCDSIATLFGVTEGYLQQLNPALDCTGSFVGLQVCVQRGPVAPLPLCSQFHDVEPGDTCDSIMKIRARPSLDPLDFFFLNPGLMCNNLLPSEGPGVPGQRVCISGNPPLATRCPSNSYYNVKLRDTCASIISRVFCNYFTLLRHNPFYVCVQARLVVGQTLCAPKTKITPATCRPNIIYA